MLIVNDWVSFLNQLYCHFGVHLNLHAFQLMYISHARIFKSRTGPFLQLWITAPNSTPNSCFIKHVHAAASL